MGSRSSGSSSSPVMGSLPFSSMYFSISRFSKTVPVFLETTGSSGASPETVVLSPSVSSDRPEQDARRLKDGVAGWTEATYWHKASCVVLDALVSQWQGQLWILGGRCKCDGYSCLELEAGPIKAGTVLQPRLQVEQIVGQARNRCLEQGTLIDVPNQAWDRTALGSCRQMAEAGQQVSSLLLLVHPDSRVSVQSVVHIGFRIRCGP